MSTINFTEIADLINSAFQEDQADNDITTNACIPPDLYAQANIILKQDGCMAGLKFLPELFKQFSVNLSCKNLAEDGNYYEAGTILAKIDGPARSLLSAERVALNLLQHLSGVATLTYKCVAKTAGTSCQILDTRKTIAGFRQLQKYAVKMGGGVNHRMDLSDRILIKNNHLTLVSLEECIKKSLESGWVEVEIDRKEMLETVINAGVNAVLLDNMSPEQVSECVALGNHRVYLEASGGITLDNIEAFAKTGVNGISIGALTHSAPAIDISMRIL